MGATAHASSLGLTLLAAACSSSSSSGGSAAVHACDPLAPPSTSLSDVLGVGQDAQGTFYVADSPANVTEPRVFVSGGGKLVRQHVLGSGESGGSGGKTGGGTEYTVSFAPAGAGASAARALLLAMQGATASQMALGPGDSKSFIGGPGETPLKVVSDGTVSSMAIINLPGVVDYVADVSDGTSIVVTSPMDLNSSADFHLFYGPADAMQERPIVSFSQALSGYPTIGFTVGSATYTMAIGGTFDPDGGGGPGPGTLDTGSAKPLAFTLRMPTPTTLSGFSFTCL